MAKTELGPALQTPYSRLPALVRPSEKIFSISHRRAQRLHRAEARDNKLSLEIRRVIENIAYDPNRKNTKRWHALPHFTSVLFFTRKLFFISTWTFLAFGKNYYSWKWKIRGYQNKQRLEKRNNFTDGCFLKEQIHFNCHPELYWNSFAKFLLNHFNSRNFRWKTSCLVIIGTYLAGKISLKRRETVLS